MGRCVHALSGVQWGRVVHARKPSGCTTPCWASTNSRFIRASGRTDGRGMGGRTSHNGLFFPVDLALNHWKLGRTDGWKDGQLYIHRV